MPDTLQKRIAENVPKPSFGTDFVLENLSKIEEKPFKNDVRKSFEKISKKSASQSLIKKSTSLLPG